MPRINFYLLSHDDVQSRLALACRLSEQLHRSGRPVRILASDEDEARAMDSMLWQFTAESFVPHALRHEAPVATPVLIDWDPQSLADGNLLNLTCDLPPHHEALDTIAEFVMNNAEAKALSRQKWNTYKQFGYDLQHHQI